MAKKDETGERRLSVRDVSEVVASRFDRQIGDSRKGGMSNLRVSQPRRLYIVGVRGVTAVMASRH